MRRAGAFFYALVLGLTMMKSGIIFVAYFRALDGLHEGQGRNSNDWNKEKSSEKPRIDGMQKDWNICGHASLDPRSGLRFASNLCEIRSVGLRLRSGPAQGRQKFTAKSPQAVSSKWLALVGVVNPTSRAGLELAPSGEMPAATSLVF